MSLVSHKCSFRLVYYGCHRHQQPFLLFCITRIHYEWSCGTWNINTPAGDTANYSSIYYTFSSKSGMQALQADVPLDRKVLGKLFTGMAYTRRRAYCKLEAASVQHTMPLLHLYSGVAGAFFRGFTPARQICISRMLGG